jgi:hypothetical protein
MLIHLRKNLKLIQMKKESVFYKMTNKICNIYKGNSTLMT